MPLYTRGKRQDAPCYWPSPVAPLLSLPGTKAQPITTSTALPPSPCIFDHQRAPDLTWWRSKLNAGVSNSSFWLDLHADIWPARESVCVYQAASVLIQCKPGHRNARQFKGALLRSCASHSAAAATSWSSLKGTAHMITLEGCIKARQFKVALLR